MIHRTYNFDKMRELIWHIQKPKKTVDKYIEPLLGVWDVLLPAD